MENSKEIQLMHSINEGMSKLMRDLSAVIDNISALTELIYNREIDTIDKEIEQTNIKLRSHM
jgi:hypothetical protein